MDLTTKVIAYVITTSIGWLIAHRYFGQEHAALAFVLISFHLFLASLIVISSIKEGELPSVTRMLLVHPVAVALMFGLGYSLQSVPFFGDFNFLLCLVAVFEVDWLFAFSGETKKKKTPVRETAQASPLQLVEPTIEDHEAFREYMMQSRRPFRKPGISINEEFNLWLAERQAKKAEEVALAATAAAVKPAETFANSSTPAK